MAFSFPRPDCVQTGTPGYAYIFDAMSGESYILLRKLAVGAQSKVQLVANVYTNEVVVRKVSKQRLPLKDASDLTSVPEDREISILDRLNSIMRNPSQPYTGLTPRWTTCLSHEDIPSMLETPTMSITTRTQLHCVRVSYWKLCNGGTLSDWGQHWEDLYPNLVDGEGAPFPVSIIARATAQICETLHVMYHAGSEAVYHCDLHAANIFVHFDLDRSGDSSSSSSSPLPDFYIGDFGWSRTASEALLDSQALHGADGSAVFDTWDLDHLGFEFPSPAPGTARPGQRRPWDVSRFMGALQSLVRLADPARGPLTPADHPPPSKQVLGLRGLMEMLRFVDDQDQQLAARNPHSRPPYLVEVVREARKLERAALAAERDTKAFREFVEKGRSQAEQMMKAEKPVVCTGVQGLSAEMRRVWAERYGKVNVDAPWSLIESI